MLASPLFRVVLLPLAMSLGVVLGLGCFHETNDDQHFAFLFQGVTAAGPVPSLPLYFHGLGQGLSALYTEWPALPWLGWLLATQLAAATVLVFAVLDKLLRPYLRPPALVLALVVFFLLAWLEHWLWFSHLRVALLLAGGALLWAAQRPGRKWVLLLGTGLLLLAWAIRPSAAMLAALAAAPAAVLLAGSWRRARPVLLAAAAALGLASLLLSLSQSPAEARFRALDSRLAAVLDYGLHQPRPRTAADSLTVAAVDEWLLGDTALVNEAALRRTYVADGPHFITRVLPEKLTARLALLARDYFPVLLALLASAGWAWRRGANRRAVILIQLGLGGLLLALAGLLKLPPRLALPLLDFWLLANLAAGLTLPGGGADRAGAEGWGQPDAYRRRWLTLGFTSMLCLLYGAKTWHRSLVLRQEQSRHEQALEEIARETSSRIRVLAGADDLLKSLSPFRSYSLGSGPVLWLTGWPSRDPSQPALYRQLTGSADMLLPRLAAKPPQKLAWVLSAPTARWLNRFFYGKQPPHLPAGWRGHWRLQPGSGFLADSTLRLYNIELKVRVYKQQTDPARPDATRLRR